jgi:hypothetical protein
MYSVPSAAMANEDQSLPPVRGRMVSSFQRSVPSRRKVPAAEDHGVLADRRRRSDQGDERPAQTVAVLDSFSNAWPLSRDLGH